MNVSSFEDRKRRDFETNQNLIFIDWHTYGSHEMPGSHKMRATKPSYLCLFDDELSHLKEPQLSHAFATRT
jgi:hypothetical protein